MKEEGEIREVLKWVREYGMGREKSGLRKDMMIKSLNIDQGG